MSLTDVVGKRPKETAPKPPRKTNGSGRNGSDRFERARKWAMKADPAIAGSGGHNATWSVARKCAQDFELDESQTLDVLREYNERCQPPWSERELAHKAKEACEKARVEVPVEDRERHRSMPAEHCQSSGNGTADETHWADGSPVDPPPYGDKEQPAGGDPKEDFANRDYFEGEIELLSQSLLESIARRKNKVDKPIETPFRDYNIALEGGFWPGLHTIVGGTGSWKTELLTSTCSKCLDDGTPTIYVSLELEATQVLCRIAAFRTGIPWSKIWLGRYSDQELAKITAELDALKGKPFRVIEGNAGGWCSSDLAGIAEAARKSFPSGPMFVGLDFLQLVGANEGERPELREKVGATAYRAKGLARQHGISVVLISSSARDKYTLLSSAADQAGLQMAPAKHGGMVKTISHPEVLVGLGKESGEIEYACDSVTVIIKWPMLVEGDRLLLLAVPKKRYGRESWCALIVHHGTRLVDYPCESPADLPQPVQDKGGKEPVSDDEYVRRVVETVRANPGKLKSARDVVKVTKGTASKVRDSLKDALRDGLVAASEDGFLYVSETH
jgi:hypothetical protein